MIHLQEDSEIRRRAKISKEYLHKASCGTGNKERGNKSWLTNKENYADFPIKRRCLRLEVVLEQDGGGDYWMKRVIGDGTGGWVEVV